MHAEIEFWVRYCSYHVSMNITLNGKTALVATRTLRANRTMPSAWGKRVNLTMPDPSPAKRFTRKLFDLPQWGLALTADMPLSLDVAVPCKEGRLRMTGVHNTIYGTRSLPPNAFIEIAEGVAISCPELLFLEMAATMPLAQLVMLGHELCGTFSRDPHDPRNGDVVLWCPPATSRENIEAFIRKAKWNDHADRALEALALTADDAWSPMESLIAAMARLPYEECGYGFGGCALNKRVDTAIEMQTVGKRSRKPDVLLEDTPVGFNYDGGVHLRIDDVVKAAMELERDPGRAATQEALDSIVQDVRAKAIDDIRRNRELTATGFYVLPVTKEDLYEEGGLDTVMLQAMETIERLTRRDLSDQKRSLRVRFIREKRQKLIWSLLPGRRSRQLKCAQKSANPHVFEAMIEF